MGNGFFWILIGLLSVPNLPIKRYFIYTKQKQNFIVYKKYVTNKTLFFPHAFLEIVH